MQYVGSRQGPLKITMFLKMQQPSGHIISKYNNNNNNNNNDNNNNNNNNIIIIIKYMPSNYSDQSVQSDERSLIT